jgi:hypothetical protein
MKSQHRRQLQQQELARNHNIVLAELKEKVAKMRSDSQLNEKQTAADEAAAHGGVYPCQNQCAQ